MSDLSVAEIDHLAKLARLTLSAEEKEKFASQLPAILGFVDQLTSWSVEGEAEVNVKPTSLENLRADEPSNDQLTLDQLEKLAPAWRDSQLEVPAVFAEATDEG